MTSRIIGIGSYLPENIVTNTDLTEFIDTSDEWIRERSGICARRISTEEGTSALAVKAAKRAIEDAGIAPEEIEIIVLATSSPDRAFPSAATDVQAAVGALNAVAFDITAACSGFIYGMHIVQGFIKSGEIYLARFFRNKAPDFEQCPRMVAVPPSGHTVIAAIIIVGLNSCLFTVITADKYAHDFICVFSGSIPSLGIRPVQLIDAHHKLMRADLPDYLTGFPVLMAGGSFPLCLGYDFLSALWAAQNIVAFWSFDYRKLLAIGAVRLCFGAAIIVVIEQIVRHDVLICPALQVGGRLRHTAHFVQNHCIPLVAADFRLSVTDILLVSIQMRQY